MKIIYKKGNVALATENFIAHGCNAQGVMGSGVAKALRDKYPEIFNDYVDYLNECKVMGFDPMGGFTGTEVGDKTIFNLITQEFYGRDSSIKYIDYDAIRHSIEQLSDALNVGEPVAMPMIGAGLGNGDWDIISSIIEESSTFQPVVYRL